MKKLSCLFLAIILCVSFTACVSFGSDKAYSVKFDDTEIIVGKTTVSTLLDNGFVLMETGKAKTGNEPLDGEQLLEKNSYYSGIDVEKDGVEYGVINIVTEKKDVTLSDAIIATVRVVPDLGHAADHVSLDGVVLSDLTLDAFQEHIAGSRVYDDKSGAICMGDQYSFSVKYEGDKLAELDAHRNYSVSYGS